MSIDEQATGTNLTFTRSPMGDQHIADTPVGRAVVTRIETTGPNGGRLWEYEIETAFTGDRVRLRTGYASFAVAKRGVALLVQSATTDTY